MGPRRRAWVKHPPRWCSRERPPATGRHQRAGAVHAVDRQRQLHPGRPLRRAAQRPVQHAGPVRGVRAGARLDRGRRQRDRRVRAQRGPAEVPAPVPAGRVVRRGHRVLLADLQQVPARAGRERRALRFRRAARAAPARRPVHRARPGRWRRHADARPRRPGGRHGRSRGGDRGGGGPGPQHRGDPGHGQPAQLRPRPAVEPRPGGHPQVLGRAERPGPRPPAQPRDRRQLPARLTVQGDRRRRCARGRADAGDGGAGPGRAAAAQQQPRHPQLQRVQLQQHRRTVAHRRADHLVQHRLRPAGHGPRRGPRPRDGRGLRHGRRDVRHPAACGGQRDRRRRGRGRARADVHRPARRPHDAHAGGDDRRDRGQRRHPDEALPRRPGAGARPHGHRLHPARGVAAADLQGRRRPAHPDDDQRGGQRVRSRRQDPGRRGGGQDRHRAGQRGRPRPRLVHGFRTGRRPEDRRRRVRGQRWRHRWRAVGADRPPGDAGLPRRAGGLMALSVGSMLAGRYEITAPIAVGGMGEVWKARDRVLNRVVAAKVLRSEFTGDPSFLARFRNEARHTAALTHPSIASVFDYGETADDTSGQQLAFLVMEFVEGRPLVSILHDEGALSVDWTLHVLSQSADGLSAAHRAGVVHRDIKPGNLMVRPDGVVKLTDFGIAQARDATPLTRTGMVVGTAQYLSPEQAQGMEVTAASDVYSLGVVAYECLTGARPFDGASQVAVALAHINRPPPPLPSHIPPAVRLLVERALAKDPADRFPDGGAFAEAIRRVAAGGTLTPAGGPATPRTTPTQVVGGATRAAPAPAGGAAAAAALAESRTQVIPTTGPGDLAAAAGPAAAGPATGSGGPMPPLQAPPDEDWDLVDDEEPRGRGRYAWIAAAVVLVLLLVGGTWFLLSDGNRGTGGAAGTTTAQTSGSPTGIQLDPAAFIGRPADEVETELKAAGLVVTQKPADDAELASAGTSLDAGDVAGLRPSGVLAAPGTQVTLYVAQKAYDPADQATEAPTTTPEKTSAPATTTSDSPTTTTPPSPTTATSPTLGGTEDPPPSDPVVPPAGDPAGAPAPNGAG